MNYPAAKQQGIHKGIVSGELNPRPPQEGLSA